MKDSLIEYGRSRSRRKHVDGSRNSSGRPCLNEVQRLDAIRVSSVSNHNEIRLVLKGRLAKDGKMEAVDIGARDWIDVDDPAAHGLASRLFAKAAS